MLRGTCSQQHLLDGQFLELARFAMPMLWGKSIDGLVRDRIDRDRLALRASPIR